MEYWIRATKPILILSHYSIIPTSYYSFFSISFSFCLFQYSIKSIAPAPSISFQNKVRQDHSQHNHHQENSE
jgi:hypothetical protein